MNARALLQNEEVATNTAAAISHGVHVSCQLGHPNVTAICGVELPWGDERAGAHEVCVVCLDLLRCPICGVTLKTPQELQR